jgi:hypothetical protein
MPFSIPGGLVYSPAELGLDAVNVAAGGGIVTGNIVPLMQAGKFSAVSLIKEAGPAGGTPGTVLYASVGLNGVQWSDGLVQSGLWAAFTNNPRTQWGSYARGQTTASLSTGTAAAGEFAKLLGSPYGRFSFQNNDGAVASVLSLTVILWWL